jgi:hypothetical protein
VSETLDRRLFERRLFMLAAIAFPLLGSPLSSESLPNAAARSGTALVI